MSKIYRTEEEIVRLAKENSDTKTRLSDQRVAFFGKNRRSEIIAYLNEQTGGNSTRWHDAWEEYLRSKGISNSKYIEEERGVFHKTSSYT